jgi:SAM-dependent methyltransferase
MMCLLRELKIRPMVTGVLSNIPGLFSWWDSRRPMGNTSSAAYARGVWRFHLENYQKFANGRLPSSIAEFGPGATLGSCIAALCDGVDRAIALDVCPYASSDSENLRILEELVPDSNRAAEHAVLREAVMHVGSGERETLLKYVAPWTDLNVLQENCVDLIFSHSVMEHVTKPVEAYKACFRWLKPGGIMSHKIDHSSHAITRSWNGHYAMPAVLWSLIVGGRPYLLNRMLPKQHRDAIESAGFRILFEDYEVAKETDRNSSCPSIKSRKEYQIKTSTFVCQKPPGKV